MRQNRFKNLIKGLMVLAAALPLASCVDNGYEYADNVDLTMGIDANGLKVKIGNTEKVLLADLLDIDDSGVKTDEKNMYYFVESGNTSFDFTIDPINITVPRTDLTAQNLLTTQSLKELFFPNGIPPYIPPFPVNEKEILAEHSHVEDHESFSTSFELTGENKDVEALNYITPANANLVIKIVIETSENIKNDVGLGRVEDLSVNIPDFIDLAVTNGSSVGGNAGATIEKQTVNGIEANYLVIKDYDPNVPVTELIICNVPIQRVNIPEDQRGAISTSRKLEIDTKIDLDAYITLETMKAFELDLSQNMYAHAHIYVAINNPEVTESAMEVENVNGKFNPTIKDVNIDPIKIAEELPDFLQDEAVVVDVKNPTIRFNVDMKGNEEKPGIPVALNFSAGLTAHGGNGGSVDLTGKLLEYTNNILYFHEDPAGPWTPNSNDLANEDYQDLPVSGISALIKKVPETISVNLNDNRIQVDQTKDYTIPLGQTYEAEINYDVYIPFEFNSELAIVYNDSACNISKDLEDADVVFEGLTIVGSVDNTIPLNLQIEFEPLDKQGKKLGMTINAGNINAGTGDVNAPVNTALEAKVQTNNIPLKQLDRINIKVRAKSAERGGDLRSDQWLQIKNLQLQFQGKVVYDANDYDK